MTYATASETTAAWAQDTLRERMMAGIPKHLRPKLDSHNARLAAAASVAARAAQSRVNNPEIRAHIIAMHERGCCRTHIGKELGMCRRTVLRVLIEEGRAAA